MYRPIYIHRVHKKGQQLSRPNFYMVIFIFTIFCTWIMLTVANPIIKFNHHTWATLTLWWRSCDGVLLLLLLIKKCRTEWVKMDHSITVAAIRQWRRHLTACVRTDGGQFEHRFWLASLANHKLADWPKPHVLILLFFDCLYEKNEFFAQTLLHKVKQ